ncbi:hypothetical protein HDU84_006541, partial [Entophlyctis sp. JEL0112]
HPPASLAAAQYDPRMDGAVARTVVVPVVAGFVDAEKLVAEMAAVLVDVDVLTEVFELAEAAAMAVAALEEDDDEDETGKHCE